MKALLFTVLVTGCTVTDVRFEEDATTYACRLTYRCEDTGQESEIPVTGTVYNAEASIDAWMDTCKVLSRNGQCSKVVCSHTCEAL